MAEDTGQEKSQEPTQKRIQDARKKGDIARSKELSTLALLMASAASALLFGPGVASAMLGVFKFNFSLRGEAIADPAYMAQHLYISLFDAFFSLWGFFLLVLLATIFSAAALGGWNFSGEALQPKGSRLDPIAGFKRMFSITSLVELFKAVGKVVIVGAIAILAIYLLRPELIGLTAEAVNPAMAHAVTILAWAFLVISAAMISIVLIDVPYQLYDYNKKLKMTMQEIKDEMKSTEGKPEVKSKIRQLQYEMSQRKMMKEVPTADVVITNPTHYAVAIRYDQSQSDAPIVVAKGVDFMALKIREVAQEYDVAVLEAPSLARALYYAAEIDEEVPSGLYTAVAQVLAYVFQLRDTGKSGPANPPPKDHQLDIPDDLRRDE
ncbi:flagellar biosynthesis protein FlhB [Nitrincola sp. A-D6]|uniref:flagellar biosynthesis protein FlhB n=1 Tax=Nitrincola sp. A-D6 TaxID=1545442 RepID=UPI00051FC2B8|nr:flagellar biosynthesis protein FlhB [Nitrincola sp. A-D6]KGK41694.1 flagellar biosynthesis protein FlhB [Nitrincola sp. A-D6]